MTLEVPEAFLDRDRVSTDRQTGRLKRSSVGQQDGFTLLVGELQAPLRHPRIDGGQRGVHRVL